MPSSTRTSAGRPAPLGTSPLAIAGALAATLALAVAPVPLDAQGFGSAVAVGSGEILIGEPGHQAIPGLVYVYRKGGAGWAEAAAITATDAVAGDRFGSSIALDGSRMIVGATDVNEDRGVAYVFERAGGDWTQVATLRPADLEPGIRFGRAAALEGDVALVVAGGELGFRTPGPAGAVYVFRRGADGAWAQEAKLQSETPRENDGFGEAVALQGDLAIIGATGSGARGEDRAGAVSLFRRGEDGLWTRQGEPFTAPDPQSNAQFGASLLLVEGEPGPSLYIGAPGAALGAGTVYAFEGDEEGGWTLTGRFFPPTAGAGGRFGGTGFGAALAMADGELWIAAPGAAGFEGRVYRYEPDEEGWGHAGVLVPEEVEPRSGFSAPLAVSGGVAAAAVRGKDYGAGTAIIFEREGGSWRAAGEVFSEPAGFEAITAGEVRCESGAAAAWGCDEVDILSFLPVHAMGAGRGVRVNDVWGWTDSQTGREYALVGMTDQASFVDVTDPLSPVYVGRLPMTDGARGSTWRDIKVFDDHAFIVSDGAGEHGMQIFDLARLREFGGEPVTFTADAHYDGIASAHNIVINERSGFAYSVGSSGGGETCGGGLHMIDVNEPTRPTFAGCFADASTGRRNTGYSHDALCIEYHGPDAEHAGKEICFGSNETALSIADVSDKENPVALSAAAYPNVGYAHQGWITDDHRYFYMDDELDELRFGDQMEGTRTLIWDITDLDDPVLVNEYFGETLTSDHNLYIVGDYAYLSNYVSGLRILDIRDPANPVEVAFFDTVPYAESPGFSGSWSNYPFFRSGTIVVTSGSEGLFMLRHRKPELIP